MKREYTLKELIEDARGKAEAYRKAPQDEHNALAAASWEVTLACLLDIRKFALDNQPRIQYTERRLR